MTRHLLKMVWNRKRVNFLIILEIFVSFLVLFGVVVSTVYLSDNYRQPLGFSYQNVWNVNVQQPGRDQSPNDKTPAITLRQIMQSVHELEEVEAVTGIGHSPYSGSSWGSSVEMNGRKIQYGVNRAADNFKDVMGLQVVNGRWFSAEDDSANFEPIVITQRLAREAYGDEDPIGRRFGELPKADAAASLEPEKERRVVGVVAEFRQHGEFAGLENFHFYRFTYEKSPSHLLIKVRPGTTRAFEEKLSRKLRGVNKDWSYEIEPLVNMRENSFKLYLAPIIAAGLVAAFLMIMVGLGLTGVLWQNVTQRIKEIGLRRAKGATANDIHTQILGELFVITTFGLLLGVVIIVQLPLLEFMSFLSTKVYFYSIGISLALIYLLTLVCGLYPSRMATKVQPVEALRYE
ncbi:MAG: ABC transporter permease [Acidobacteria bacterium]|nr:ABC transporter permease [Acidobacteriota bacterium]